MREAVGSGEQRPIAAQHVDDESGVGREAVGHLVELFGHVGDGEVGARTRFLDGDRQIDGTVAGQLDGSLEHDWAPDGLVLSLRVPLANLRF